MFGVSNMRSDMAGGGVASGIGNGLGSSAAGRGAPVKPQPRNPVVGVVLRNLKAHFGFGYV